ncbi:hypothetical protein D3P06_12650 [Paracoccus aestuarii]|uniref:Uncharacterized protein n=1 Tax=Paracoccus aestuarii TaxID=453842 RepID=A0A418ZUA1_9RHOB|nr:hypothetical protein [Paracoccus aestuarii]RJL01174.1 hypothetical protein D3P06_12650 [Paracoccus aestuarii]WCR01268.1 hypothetical protein JHW48_18060 [Paracoccus aestuarii]
MTPRGARPQKAPHRARPLPFGPSRAQGSRQTGSDHRSSPAVNPPDPRAGPGRHHTHAFAQKLKTAGFNEKQVDILIVARDVFISALFSIMPIIGG